MKGKYLLHGAASEIITPFTQTGEVDYELLESEFEFLINNGITGLFVNGLASESLMVDIEQRVEIVKRAVSVSNKRIPVLGNLINNSVDLAIQCMKRYEECGVDGIFITPPLVYQYTGEGLYDYFSGIASATCLPVYIYNAPETGNKVPPEILARLFKNILNLRGYKDSTQDIIHQQTLIDLIGKERHFELMAGSDAQILPTSLLGGKGVVSLITCVFPKLILDLLDAIEKKDFEQAQELQGKVLRVRQALKVGPFMGAYKYVSEIVGSPLGKMKAPLREVSESDKKKIKDMLICENMI